MAIVVVLVILAAVVLCTLGGALLASLFFGGLLLAAGRARILVPIFFVVFPSILVGAFTGSATVGYFAVRENENLILRGPLGGLILGAIVGSAIGIGGALVWWWRVSRARYDQHDHAKA